MNPAPTKSPSAVLAALIPAWNPGDELLTTIESIVTQPVLCEIFVVDDGSEPAIKLPSQMAGKPIHLIRLNKNLGIAAALNTGLNIILENNFQFISRHDCGDIDHIDRLRKQLGYLEQNENVKLVGSSVKFETPNRQLQYVFCAPATQATIKRRMRYSAAIIHSSCMFRANVFSEIGLYSDQYPHAEDYDLFFRLLANHEIQNLPDVLVTAHYSKNSISMFNRRASLASRLKLQIKYFDWLSFHGYLGVLQTMSLNIIPYRLVSLLKSATSTFRKK